MASELLLARPSPVRAGLKPLVLAKTSASSLGSLDGRGPLGVYVETSADRPIIVQPSRPSPLYLPSTSRKCSGPRRRRVPSGRIASLTQRQASREVSESYMSLVFHSPNVDDELLSSPAPRTAAADQRHMAARRARSETFAFPAPPSGGLAGLGLGTLPEMANRTSMARRIPNGTQWLEDISDYVNGLNSPGLTGTQGWSPASSAVSSPEASPILRPTAPLAVRKRNSIVARRSVSQPAHMVVGDAADDSEPKEYPFPSSMHNDDAAARLQRLQLSLDQLRLASPMADSFWQNSSAALALQEHRAPSLAEQMAFACGLGSDLEWEAPKQAHVCVHTSASAYLSGTGDHEDTSPLGVRSVEVGSSWNHAQDEIVQEDEASFWMVPQAAHLREAAEDEGGLTASSGSSDVSSQVSTPGSEALSATTSFSFAAESIASSATSLGAEREADEKRPGSGSPPLVGSFDEFSYLLAAPLSPQPSKQGSVPCEIFSPALDTPALGLLATPAPMDSLPSPVLTSASISPQLASASSPSVRSQLTSPVELLRQQSTFSDASEREAPASVLARPRPITRKAGVFGTEMERGSSSASRSSTPRSEQASPVVVLRQVPRRPVHAPPCVPARRSSRTPEATPAAEPTPSPVVVAPVAPAAASVRRVPVPKGPSPATSARAALPRSHSELLPSMKGPVPVLSARALAEVREACKQKQAFLRAAATGQRLPAAPSVCVPVSRSVHFSADEAPAMRSTLSTASCTSAFSATSGISTHSAPAQLTGSHATPRQQMLSSRSLPTLFVARTPSQRKRGTTGIPATEPANRALASLGIAIKRPTRSSKVQALSGALAATPSGVVLVVEETVEQEEQVLVVM